MDANTGINHEQYMLLSQLSYQDLTGSSSAYTGKTVKEMMQDGQYKNHDGWDFSKVGEWEILSHVNNYSGTGFSGTAFRNSEGKIIFSMRGTEQEDSKVETLVAKDFITDAQLALKGEALGKPNQFLEAYEFVRATVSNEYGINVDDLNQESLSKLIQTNGISYTGHSLGGGIDQYLTYMTGEKAYLLML